ncbi:hypothetical protein A2U01_0090251, partial [Trifolium medium]|nr:hypothetical protein [Trifolium medium]
SPAVTVAEKNGRREAHVRIWELIWELHVGSTCMKGSGTQKRLWRRLVTGEAPSSLPNYSAAVGGGAQ